MNQNAEINMGIPMCGETEVRQKMVALICEELGCNMNDVRDTTRFVADLGADSLDCVELCMFFEEEFDIFIPDEQTEHWHTFGEAFRGVWKLIQQNNGKIPAANYTDPTPKLSQVTIQQANDLAEVVTDPRFSAARVGIRRNERDVDTYQQGYELGKKNGIRRRARLYRDGDENKPEFSRQRLFIDGYNDGYRAGRKDYKQH